MVRPAIRAAPGFPRRRVCGVWMACPPPLPPQSGGAHAGVQTKIKADGQRPNSGVRVRFGSCGHWLPSRRAWLGNVKR